MQVRRTLKKLKESNEIDTNRTPSYQLVTIVKYDDYQSKQSCDNTQITPNNNDNNVNNISTMDIKVLKDAYAKNDRLHQLTYNSIKPKIKLFKIVLRGFLCFFT